MFAIAIDIDALTQALEEEHGRAHYLDLEDGALLRLPAGAAEPGSEEKYRVDPERYLHISPLPFEQKLQMREAFLQELEDHALHLVLSHALQGRRALRSFAYQLEQQPALQQAWTRFHRQRLHEYALEWLQENGLHAHQTSHWR